MIKFASILVITALLVCTIFIALRSGDLLLEYLAKSLGFKISYANRCGFVSAFIFKTAKLKSVALEGFDYPLKIKCERVYISFDYSSLLKKKAIGLYCEFNNPVFVQEFDSSPFAFLPTLGASKDHRLDSINCDLLLYGRTAEFLSLTVNTARFIAKANGIMTDDGRIDMNIKLFFSPEFIKDYSNELDLFLEEEPNGWMSSTFNIKKSNNGPLFKLESEMLRLTIGEKN